MNDTNCDASIASFSPDWVSPPGDTILDILEERDWSQQQLADRLGFSLKHVNQLIRGKVSLTEDAAIRSRYWASRVSQNPTDAPRTL